MDAKILLLDLLKCEPKKGDKAMPCGKKMPVKKTAKKKK